MEGSPTEIDVNAMITEIQALSNDEVGIHDFHLWSISMGKYALSAHVETTEP